MPMPISSPVGQQGGVRPGGINAPNASGISANDERNIGIAIDAVTGGPTGFGAVLGPSIIGLFTHPPAPFYVDPRTGKKMNFSQGTGPPDQPAAQGSFSPVAELTGGPFNRNIGPFGNNPFLNPYGRGGGGAAIGRSAIYGGPGDLMKSIATRDIAVQGLMSGLNRPDVPSGLMGALQGGAQQLGGRLGTEEFQNIQPGLERGFTQYGDQYRNQLSGLLNQAYVQGGQLYGSGQAAFSQAKQQNAIRRLAQIQSVQGILGTIPIVGQAASGGYGAAASKQ